MSNPDVKEPETLETEESESKPSKRKKPTGKKQKDIEGLPTEIVTHYLSDAELIKRFGVDGWKRPAT